MNKEVQEIVGNEKLTRSVRKENCSFRHDTNKRVKSTQPNPSPGSSTQQSVKNASISPRGKKPKWENGSTAVQGLLQRNLQNFIL